MTRDRQPLKNGVGAYTTKAGIRRYRVVMKANGKTVQKAGFDTK